MGGGSNETKSIPTTLRPRPADPRSPRRRYHGMKTQNKKYHYCYSVINKSNDMMYIGVRSSDTYPSNDLGVTYFTSSNTLAPMFKNNPQDFIKNFRLFPTRELAVKHEILLHKIFNVGVNPVFYNKSRQTSTGFDCDWTGKNHTEETKNKFKNRVLSEETKRKIGDSSKNNTHNIGMKWVYNLSTYEERRIRKDESVPVGFKKGRLPQTKEHRLKNSQAKKGNTINKGRVYYFNKTTGETKFLNKQDIVPDGFTRGFGKKWFHCPKTDKMVFCTESEKPEGYIKGQSLERKIKSSESKKGATWYHNPQTGKTTLVALNKNAPDGFIKGRGSQSFYLKTS